MLQTVSLAARDLEPLRLDEIRMQLKQVRKVKLKYVLNGLLWLLTVVNGISNPYNFICL